MLRSDEGNKKIDISTLEEKLKELGQVLKEYSPSLVAAYLFGSCANGKVGPLSDIDIAILISNENEDCYLETKVLMDLMAILETEKVDLINLDNAPLHIQYGVLKSKKVIFSSDDLKRIDFETRVIKKYLDFKHVREMHDQIFLQRIGLEE
ncbi:MAG: hypothetical protein VR72_11685 [Clostridiaceae bacterium BRH_c20a]|nr:MAG: hypothetical protein VR72_11685 [Clostridiaceae bacterium BRH_c20a]